MSIEFEKINSIDKSDISKDKLIEVKKRFSKFQSIVNPIEDDKVCELCGSKVTSYCKSHTIPQFILKQVSNNGHLSTGQSMLDIPILKKSYGVGEALVFKCICDDCDNTKFQSYENPDKYSSKLSDDMIKQIALKNNLRMYDKSINVYNTFKKIHEEIPTPYINAKITVAKLDMQDYHNTIKRHEKTKFYTIDDFILPYMALIAFQGILNMLVDLDGILINDLYNLNPNYRIQGLHVMVFPNNGYTHITLFIRDGDTRYRGFYKKFRRLNLEEKLYALNYMILLYSEDWVLNPSFAMKINDETIDLIRSTVDPEGQSDNYEDYKKHRRQVMIAAKEKFIIPIKGTLFNFLDENSKLL